MLVREGLVSGAGCDRQFAHAQSLKMIAAAPHLGKRAGHRRGANLARLSVGGGVGGPCLADRPGMFGVTRSAVRGRVGFLQRKTTVMHYNRPDIGPVNTFFKSDRIFFRSGRIFFI